MWDAGGGAFAAAAARFLDAGVPVAAICGATAGLARAGLLDKRLHTSAAAGYLMATGTRAEITTSTSALLWTGISSRPARSRRCNLRARRCDSSA